MKEENIPVLREEAVVLEEITKNVLPVSDDEPVTPRPGYYTVADIEALPEGQRAELIDGRWYDMATPRTIHQRIVSVFVRLLGNHIAEKGGSCEVFPSPFGVYLNNDDRNYLEPDVVMICDPSKITEKGCIGAPDLVIEILSPSTRNRDMFLKLNKYHRAGVREYWIIDPDRRIIITYFFMDRELREGCSVTTVLSFDDTLTSAIDPDFSVVLSEHV